MSIIPGDDSLLSMFGMMGPPRPQTAEPVPGMIDEPVMDEDPDDVVAPGFKRTKRNILGKIADAILMAYGNKPIYEGRMREKDLSHVMEGFSHDPLSSIQGMARLPGMADEAFGLLDKYQDNQRADAASETLAESRRAKFYPRIGGLLRNISKAQDPNAAYRAALPLIRRLQEKAGDSGSLPDTYDQQAINNYVAMNIDPEDQIRQEMLDAYRSQRLYQGQQRIDETGRYHDERLEDFDMQEEGKNRRAAEAEAGRNARSNNVAPKAVMTRLGAGEMSPDGTKVKIDKNGKSYIYLLTEPGNLNSVKLIETKEIKD